MVSGRGDLAVRAIRSSSGALRRDHEPVTDTSVGRVELRPLEGGDEGEAIAAHRELADDHFTFLLGWGPSGSWTDYLASLERLRLGVDVPTGLVPATFLVGVLDERIVGRVSIRHELNEHLRTSGGHIGYGVRPADRRRGVATQMLSSALDLAPSLVVDDEVLLTCADSNTASAAVIERCGGRLDDVRIDPLEGELSRVYAIALLRP